jgi:hypothetical protein
MGGPVVDSARGGSCSGYHSLVVDIRLLPLAPLGLRKKFGVTDAWEGLWVLISGDSELKFIFYHFFFFWQSFFVLGDRFGVEH